MKRSSLIGLLIIAMLAIAGCGSNDDANNTVNENSANTNEAENNNNETTTDASDDSERNKEVMSIGDTGLINDEIGRFEITPTKVEVFPERDGITPGISDSFILVHFTAENVSDKKIEGKGIASSHRLNLESDNDRKSPEVSDTVYGYEFVERFEGELDPGEKIESQMIFELDATDGFTLNYGSGSASIEDAVWYFSKEDIERE